MFIWEDNRLRKNISFDQSKMLMRKLTYYFLFTNRNVYGLIQSVASRIKLLKSYPVMQFVYFASLHFPFFLLVKRYYQQTL